MRNQFTRRDMVYLLLTGFFVSNAIIAEVTGGKLIEINLAGKVMLASVGVFSWPVVFIITDLVNEYFGVQGVRRLSFVTAALILFAFATLYVAMIPPAAAPSPVKDDQFNAVFGQGMWIIAGSVTAFLTSQLIDVVVFWFFRSRTGGKMLWLRATGSTVISQLVDTFIVLGIAFWLPGFISTSDYINISLTNYSLKLAIAVGMTPVIYLLHAIVDRYLGVHAAQPEGAGANGSS
ncbi:MAG: hypothetical protein GMKNLPBB_02867 [Myxococcota bacterium]|nr:hypothetical protein [Myxococcota bacterium]